MNEFETKRMIRRCSLSNLNQCREIDSGRSLAVPIVVGTVLVVAIAIIGFLYLPISKLIYWHFRADVLDPNKYLQLYKNAGWRLKLLPRSFRSKNFFDDQVLSGVTGKIGSISVEESAYHRPLLENLPKSSPLPNYAVIGERKISSTIISPSVSIDPALIEAEIFPAVFKSDFSSPLPQQKAIPSEMPELEPILLSKQSIKLESKPILETIPTQASVLSPDVKRDTMPTLEHKIMSVEVENRPTEPEPSQAPMSETAAAQKTPSSQIEMSIQKKEGIQNSSSSRIEISKQDLILMIEEILKREQVSTARVSLESPESKLIPSQEISPEQRSPQLTTEFKKSMHEFVPQQQPIPQPFRETPESIKILSIETRSRASTPELVSFDESKQLEIDVEDRATEKQKKSFWNVFKRKKTKKFELPIEMKIDEQSYRPKELQTKRNFSVEHIYEVIDSDRESIGRQSPFKKDVVHQRNEPDDWTRSSPVEEHIYEDIDSYRIDEDKDSKIVDAKKSKKKKKKFWFRSRKKSD